MKGSTNDIFGNGLHRRRGYVILDMEALGVLVCAYQILQPDCSAGALRKAMQSTWKKNSISIEEATLRSARLTVIAAFERRLWEAMNVREALSNDDASSHITLRCCRASFSDGMHNSPENAQALNIYCTQTRANSKSSRRLLFADKLI